jgi:hypothetical protein
MQVQVNPQVAARNIAEFIKSHGGNAQHMEVLELMARVCGFTSYHALKVADQTQKQDGSAAAPLSNADRGQHPQGKSRRSSTSSRWSNGTKKASAYPVPSMLWT